MFIGIGATGLVGKDTLFKVLSFLLKDKINCERFALADLLKLEVNQFCKEKYGISAFTKNSEEKELLRDLFVVHGKIMRKKTQGAYWYKLLQPAIDESLKNNNLPICTDIRYATYIQDELFWLKKINKGIYIHVNRLDKNGNKIKPLNIEEEFNSKILEKEADFTLTWQTSDNFDYLCDVVNIQLKPLIDKIIS